MNDSSDVTRVPEEGALLGIDFGTKRIGIAIAVPEQTIASPLEIYHRRNERLDLKYFQEVIQEYRIKGIVLGLPLHVNGEESGMSHQVRQFAKWMQTFTDLPIEFWDERYTSAVADEYMLNVDMSRKKRKKRMDMVAAQVMLQSFLNYRIQEKRAAEWQDAEDAEME